MAENICKSQRQGISMANQYKKLQKKLYEKNKPDDKKKEPKIGKDYPILILIGLTIFICFIGWGNLDNMNRAMYVLLLISLILTYVRRHAKLSDCPYVLRINAIAYGIRNLSQHKRVCVWVVYQQQGDEYRHRGGFQ